MKPTVVGTTAHSSKENVRSFGYSIYYTLVNIGGAAGPFVASFVRQRMSVENVFRVAALSVFLMFLGVLIFFREPNRDRDSPSSFHGSARQNFLAVVTNPRFMLFLMIFTGFWIVYWQEFITLPLYVHSYISPTIDTELLLMTGPLVVIALTVLINLLTAKVPPLVSITAGVLISSLAWILLILMPTGLGAVLTLVVIALGEITLSPPYYDYVSRLAPEGQQGTYMGFAFLPLGIGSLVGGAFGGYLLHFYGEVKHQPAGMWWVIMGVGVATAVLLWIYDRFMVRKPADELASAEQVKLMAANEDPATSPTHSPRAEKRRLGAAHGRSAALLQARGEIARLVHGRNAQGSEAFSPNHPCRARTCRS